MSDESTEERIQDFNTAYGWPIARGLSYEQLEALVAEQLNRWILTDFDALVQFLYRVDISESKLRLVLKEERHTDAGLILARLVLERQWQKIQTRKQFRQGNADSDEERW
jgi:hypothetical protein